MKSELGLPKKRDVLSRSSAVSVLKSVTSLIYHLPPTIPTPASSRGPPRRSTDMQTPIPLNERTYVHEYPDH